MTEFWVIEGCTCTVMSGATAVSLGVIMFDRQVQWQKAETTGVKTGAEGPRRGQCGDTGEAPRGSWTRSKEGRNQKDGAGCRPSRREAEGLTLERGWTPVRTGKAESETEPPKQAPSEGGGIH